jgi:hypothetical protein
MVNETDSRFCVAVMLYHILQRNYSIRRCSFLEVDYYKLFECKLSNSSVIRTAEAVMAITLVLVGACLRDVILI